jgi:hypothetical protein
VRSNRVNGDLAVSRALGDFSYKARADLPAEEQQVSAEPDIEVQMIDKTEEFLVLACDGELLQSPWVWTPILNGFSQVSGTSCPMTSSAPTSASS